MARVKSTSLIVCLIVYLIVKINPKLIVTVSTSLIVRLKESLIVKMNTNLTVKVSPSLSEVECERDRYGEPEQELGCEGEPVGGVKLSRCRNCR
jgi:hypothetical protein